MSFTSGLGLTISVWFTLSQVGSGWRRSCKLYALTCDMTFVLAEGSNVHVERLNATCLVSSGVERIRFVCYTSSKMPTTLEENTSIYVSPLEQTSDPYVSFG